VTKLIAPSTRSSWVERMGVSVCGPAFLGFLDQRANPERADREPRALNTQPGQSRQGEPVPKTFVIHWTVAKVAENHTHRMQDVGRERHVQNLAWGSALEFVCNDGDSRREGILNSYCEKFGGETAIVHVLGFLNDRPTSARDAGERL